MYYLYFSITFAWCCFCVGLTFMLCLRAFYLQKVEKLDPINAVKTSRKIKEVTARKRIELNEVMDKILENG